jgi:hypothetical protein
MVDITEISAVVAAAGVLVGVVYYILDLKHNTRAREMEICRLVVSDYDSEQAIQRYGTMMNMEWKDSKDFMEKYGQSNPEMLSIWTSWFFAWEMMGILLKNKVVRAEEMHDLGGYSAIFAWEKFKGIIQGYRDNTVWGQDFLSNAEFFAQEMLKIKIRNDPGFKDRLETFKRTLKP